MNKELSYDLVAWVMGMGCYAQNPFMNSCGGLHDKFSPETSNLFT
jgi:hypothetical protein